MTLAIACPSLALRQPGNCERAPPIPALAPPPPCPCLPHLVLVYFVVCSTVAKFRLLLLDPHPSYAARRCLVFIPRGNWQIVCNYGFLGIPNTKPFHHVRSRNTSNYKPTTYLPPGTPSRPGYVKPLPTVSRQHCHDSARYIHTNISRSSYNKLYRVRRHAHDALPRRPLLVASTDKDQHVLQQENRHTRKGLWHPVCILLLSSKTSFLMQLGHLINHMLHSTHFPGEWYHDLDMA